MTLVVDASVACKWFIAENDSTVAEALLASGEALAAPDLILAEVGNVLWKKLRSGEVDPDQARAAIDSMAGFFDSLVASASLAARSLEIARAVDHPIYDCFYLALAETLAAPLLTADARFLERVAGKTWERRIMGLSDWGARSSNPRG